MDAAVAELVGLLPEGVVVVDADAVEKYRFDWTHDATAGTPLAAVRVENAEHVQVTMRWASAHGIPVVPRGAGSGLSGGALAVDGGIVLSTERMRAIEIDTASRVAVVEPGALNVEVKRAAAEHGLWYPPDPSSYEICSIGGNIATNAGGLCCVKYGVTTDYVLGLDVVLADGTLVTLGGKRVKDVAGLPLLKLFVGSEGTLGIVTRATLRLVPAQAPTSTVVATFPTVAAAAAAVIELGRTVRASLVELMDHASINAVEDFRPMGLDRDAGALLLIQSDAPGGARADEVAVATAACEVSGAKEVFSTDDPEEGEMFVQARRLHFTAIESRGTVLPEDVGVPIPQLPALLAAVEAIARAARRRDPGRRPRRRRQHPPGDHPRPRRRRCRAPRPPRVRRDHGHRDRAGRHDHRRARCRPAQDRLARGAARPRRHGAHPPGQGGPGPARHPQPGRRFLTPPGHGHGSPGASP